MTHIIINAPGPGLMQEDKHDRYYLSDEELDAILPATGYAIVSTPWICTDGSSPKAYGRANHRSLASTFRKAQMLQRWLPLLVLPLNFPQRFPVLTVLRFSRLKMPSASPR